MKILPVIITINLILSLLIIGYEEWLDKETSNLENLKKEYIKDIHKLEKISNINLWIDDIVVSTFVDNSFDEEAADKNLISFYNLYKEKFNLGISRYIYQGKDTKNIELSYEVSIYEKSKIRDLLSIKNDKGLLQFKSLRVDNSKISGIFEVAQPYKKVLDVSK